MLAKYRSFSLIGGVSFLGLAGLIAWSVSRNVEEGGSKRSGSAEDSGGSSLIMLRDGSGSNPSHAERSSSVSAEQFAQLKQQLAAYNADCTGWISPQFESYIERLLTELQFSPEMLEVLILIEDSGYASAKRGIHGALKLRLQQPESTAARRNAVVVAGDTRWSDYAEKLCWYVGEASSIEELEVLKRLASDPFVERHLDLGRNLSLVALDPVAAVGSTMAYYHEGQGRGSTSTILSQLFERLPVDTDFGAVDALLPASVKKNDEAYFQQARLLEAWGGVDPAAAANHVLDDLERYSPEMMEYVIAPYARDHTDEALVWIQNFPAGPHSDVAISAVFDQIADTRFEEARELAARIVDPQMRSEALEKVDFHESGVR